MLKSVFFLNLKLLNLIKFNFKPHFRTVLKKKFIFGFELIGRILKFGPLCSDQFRIVRDKFHMTSDQLKMKIFK
jgi:hypothetical protein